MSDHIIRLQGVTKRFGALTAVDDVTVDVPAGRCFAWLGPNGCGKTTLIRMMLGLARTTAGSIEVCGHSVPGDTAAALARVGGIVEEPRFYPYLTGRDNLEVWAKHYGGDSRTRIDSVLARVGLGERGDEAVKVYSLGMRQRLGVARALLNDPQLLILDEPTNGLDPAGLAEFRDLIREFVDEGRSVFISSHILGEVQKIADDVAIIQRGKVVAFGGVKELIEGGGQKIYARTTNPESAAAFLDGSRGLGLITTDEHGGLTIEVDAISDELLAFVGKILHDNDLPVYSLYPLQQTLEQRFLDLTDGEVVL